MHRQSLGSPASKLQSPGILFSSTRVNNNKNNNNDNNNFISEDHSKDKSSSSSARTTDNEKRMSQKHNQQISLHESSFSSSYSSKLVHLIPLLTFFCFLILYLSSHDPSNTGQTQFSEFATRSSKKIGVDDNVGGGSMEIRSVRKLKQIERLSFHKKFRQ